MDNCSVCQTTQHGHTNDTSLIDEKLMFMSELLRDTAKNFHLPNFGQEYLLANGTQIKIGASQYIAKALEEKFSFINSLNTKINKTEYLWRINALDGTYEYEMELPSGYSINVGLLEKKSNGHCTPVGGIIYMPSVDTMIIGNKYVPYKVFKNSNIQKISHGTTDKIVGYICGQDPEQLVVKFYEDLSKNRNMPLSVIKGGSYGAGLAALLTGQINVLAISEEISESESVAAQALLESVGGFAFALDGIPYHYDKNENQSLYGLIASIPFSPEEILF